MSNVEKTSALVGLYTYAEFGLCVAGFLPILGLSHLLHRADPTQRTPGRWMRRLGRTASSLTPLWKFSVEGAPPSDIESTPYVVVANHESQADPFLLSFLPWDMRWIAKQELFDQPVIGLAMRFGGDIPVRRGDGESVRAMMAEAKAALSAGISVMMFPEGTRGSDGKLLPFKEGAFDLAIAAGVGVLPVALSGTRECRPKHSKWFGHARATARVLEAIPPRAPGEGAATALAAEARVRIQRGLDELRAR